MKNFNRNSHSGRSHGSKFGSRDGGRRDFGSERGGRSTMYPATCAECGNPCEVPFQPRAGQPVFCNNCFGKNGGRDQRRPDNRRDNRPNGEERRMFSAVCDDCGNPCEVPFQPTAGKPIFCKSCFSNKGGRKSDGATAPARQAPDQFAALHAKLDKIISTLSAGKAPERLPKKALVKAVIKAKPRTVKKKKAK